MRTLEAKDAVRTALISADPRLSRYDPLGRIVFYDDFDHGLSGWTELRGNYRGPGSVAKGAEATIFNVHPSRRDYRPAMLSNMTMPDVGTHGAMQGTYSMKLATRPVAGHASTVLKRVTWSRRGIYQAECFFTYAPEPSSLRLGEEVFGSFTIGYDFQDDDYRYHVGVRYLNAENGELRQKWQYLVKGDLAPGATSWDDDSYRDIPGGSQKLCYNETVTKKNWHYLRWVVDIEKREYVELQCNDRTFDMRGLGPELEPAYQNLWALLNLAFCVQADSGVRSFFLVDSVLLSTDR